LLDEKKGWPKKVFFLKFSSRSHLPAIPSKSRLEGDDKLKNNLQKITPNSCVKFVPSCVIQHPLNFFFALLELKTLFLKHFWKEKKNCPESVFRHKPSAFFTTRMHAYMFLYEI